MPIIKFKHTGDFTKTKRFLDRVRRISVIDILNRYGRLGVEALERATPVDTGKTAQSWDYEVVATEKGYSIYWTNSNVNHGIPIVVLIQYGHATGTGGYVQPNDFINPALIPVLDKLADSAWREVTNA